MATPTEQDVQAGVESAAELAELIRNSTAWLQAAADRLDQGQFADAATIAHLGRFGLDGAMQLMDEVAGLPCMCPSDERVDRCRRHGSEEGEA